MRYRVSSMLTCNACGNSRLQPDEEIYSDDEKGAVTEFKKKYRLCRDCMEKGTQSAVKFEAQPNVELIDA